MTELSEDYWHCHRHNLDTRTPEDHRLHERYCGHFPDDAQSDAVYHALLYILQWSDDEARKLRPLAPEEFMRALSQDGYRVVPI